MEGTVQCFNIYLLNILQLPFLVSFKVQAEIENEIFT